jgi:hypothetical protein
MRSFVDAQGDAWLATAVEEDTPRHHGRWYLIFHPEGDETRMIPVPEVRWQNRPTAERTLQTMSVFELRRRLQSLLGRSAPAHPRESRPANRVVSSEA